MLWCKSMKIAVVASSCPPFISGGISSAHYNLALALRARGLEVKLFTFDDEQAALPQDPPFVVRTRVPRFAKTLPNLACRIYFALRRDHALRRHLSYYVNCQPGAFLAGRKIRKFRPDVLVLPDNGCPGLGIGAVPNCRTVLISHHNPKRFTNPLIFDAEVSLCDVNAASILERFSLRHVETVICPSAYMEQCFRQTHDFVGPVHVLPNILDKSLLEAIVPRSAAQELGLPTETPVVYVPSGTSPPKGKRWFFEIVRRILEKCPDVAFFVSGGPSSLFTYELRTSGLEKRIFCPGVLPYAENLSFVAGSTVCVSPTIIENFGMAIIEAQYFGLPAISFDVGGNKEAMRDGISGWCVPYPDVDMLIKKTLCALSFEAEAASKIRAAAKEHARSIMSDEVIDAYIRVLRGEAG